MRDMVWILGIIGNKIILKDLVFIVMVGIFLYLILENRKIEVGEIFRLDKVFLV